MLVGLVLDVTDVANAFATSYIEAAAMVYSTLYDHLLTLSEEIELIWKLSFSLVKILFLINQYSVLGVMLIQTWSMAGFVTGLNDHVCHDLFFAVSTWQLIAGGGILPCGLCTANFIAILISAIINIWILLGNISYAPQINQCVCMQHPEYVWVIWVTPLIYETIIFGMIAYKTWTHLQEDIQMPIITMLWQDGILYFTVLIAVCLYTILVWIVAPRDSRYITPSWVAEELSLLPMFEWLGIQVITWMEGINEVDSDAIACRAMGIQAGNLVHLQPMSMLCRDIASKRRETEVMRD
ncbi:hypothetical protein DACRYDRAFT_88321 [Dacryopinax primogenitus]|uniref:DUF6533 domain-containing protein n=1 Tax=Dacryopinax primogenitus (strain DJM 731) TaxID=1858805 RepID=M5GBH5_DACPD|nr:uncharacterized protein DACRYDRAFT_88321 [Dacryopinax primogenitus]EJU03407.1 hypothetical protein DACRYDRAFT_88321 [Dacryopinax primogenitus]